MPKPLDEIWDDIREELRADTADFKFHIWIEPLELAGVRGRTLYIRAPEHIRTSVAERYLPLLRRAAAGVFDSRATVEIVGADWTPPRPATADGEPGASGRPVHPTARCARRVDAGARTRTATERLGHHQRGHTDV